MRRYIRHPFDVTIHYTVNAANSKHPESLENISEGGLCFNVPDPIATGSEIHIEIPVHKPAFELDGIVVWCEEREGTYEVGVQFDDESKKFALRIVEQVCHITHYMREILHHEGRDLSTEEAAREWIEKYAHTFPY